MASSSPRARDLGIPFAGNTGQCNAITDVIGVEVGYSTIQNPKINAQTGVTAILPRSTMPTCLPVWSGLHSFNGNGELTGSHWINEAGYFHGPILLTNTHAVGVCHQAASAWMIKQYPAHYQDNHAWAMPVVGETYDGTCNDINAQHVTPSHALEAINAAHSGPLSEGNIGGGTGMTCYDFKGGTGTSSRVINIDQRSYTFGALVQANFGSRPQLQIRGVPVGQHLPLPAINQSTTNEQGSIIVVIATDAPLLPSQLQRIAKRGSLGIGRTGSIGGNYSGDIMLAFSVANAQYFPPIGQAQPAVFDMQFLNDAYLDQCFNATIDAVEEAIINALIAATSTTTFKPKGIIEAIDHQQLRRIMADHQRLDS